MILTLLQRPINSAVLSIASKNLIAFLESGVGVGRGGGSVCTPASFNIAPPLTPPPICQLAHQPTNQYADWHT